MAPWEYEPDNDSELNSCLPSNSHSGISMVVADHLAPTWWRHQMETFSALLAFCAGNSPVTGEFPAQGPVTRSFDGFFDLSLSKRLNKQSRRRWFETPSCSLWRHCNDMAPGQLQPSWWRKSLVLLVAFGSVEEPIASCMMVHFKIYRFTWQLIYKFSTVEKNFLPIF